MRHQKPSTKCWHLPTCEWEQSAVERLWQKEEQRDTPQVEGNTETSAANKTPASCMFVRKYGCVYNNQQSENILLVFFTPLSFLLVLSLYLMLCWVTSALSVIHSYWSVLCQVLKSNSMGYWKYLKPFWVCSCTVMQLHCWHTFVFSYWSFSSIILVSQMSFDIALKRWGGRRGKHTAGAPNKHALLSCSKWMPQHSVGIEALISSWQKSNNF